MKRRHYCYLLTRPLPEGGCRYYVGIRTAPEGKTPETDTSYMGGGPWIRRAVKAHPGEFTKTIVETFKTIAEAKAMERALVGLATANSPWSYNLMEGGQGGGLLSEATKARMRASQRRRYEDPDELAAQAERMRELARSPLTRKKISTTRKRVLADRTPEERRQMTSKATEATRTPAAREKRSAIAKAQWASMTPEERCTEGKRRWLVAQETRRTKREVQWILAALIVNKYGGAEAA